MFSNKKQLDRIEKLFEYLSSDIERNFRKVNAVLNHICDAVVPEHGLESVAYDAAFHPKTLDPIIQEAEKDMQLSKVATGEDPNAAKLICLKCDGKKPKPRKKAKV